ncbi:MAG: anaerobic sulfatase maturase [Armatimonadota bacterium]
MKPFTLLIKPASADCNLRCEYCFYLGKANLYPDSQIHRMDDMVLQKLISSYMQTEQPQYVFNWQGGEPLLMGTDFFKQVVELQTQYGRRGSVVGNSIQTNTTLITDELASLMAEYRFLTGVSLDGPPELHDRFRTNAAGAGSHAQVIKGIECLNRNKAEFNILTLVSAANVHHGKQVFQYLHNMGIQYHQYIPCVEFDIDGNPLPWTITGEEWGTFLCDIFDEWIYGNPYGTSVRLFDSILTYLVDGYRTLCQMDSSCCQYFVVEHNGDIYPCDFFVDSSLKLGNISTNKWSDIGQSEIYKEFGKQKAQYPDECSECGYLQLCMGDCLKHRIGAKGSIVNKSWLCKGWKAFYEHSMPGFQKLARSIIDQRKMITTTKSSIAMPEAGRNDPCPCGSGKKFKKCHGASS